MLVERPASDRNGRYDGNGREPPAHTLKFCFVAFHPIASLSPAEFSRIPLRLALQRSCSWRIRPGSAYHHGYHVQVLIPQLTVPKVGRYTDYLQPNP